MKIVSEVALISINGTLFVQLLSFLFFLWLINRLMIQPLRQAVEERRFYISRIKDETVAAEKSCDKRSRDMALQEAQVRQQGALIRQEHEQLAAEQAQQLIFAAEAQIRQIRAEAEAAQARNLEMVRSQIGDLAPQLATAIMEKLLERRLAP